MAVTPGNNFKLADLTALATAANSISSVNYDLTSFYGVLPMYLDNNGHNYGYRQMGTFKLVSGNRGTGYKVGDNVNLGLGTTFGVAAVDGSGGILGLVCTSNDGFAPGTTGGGWETANDPISPYSLTGGSGSSAQISFTVSHVGPNAAYSFPDYEIGAKLYADQVYVVNGGSGYVVGNTVAAGGQSFSVATTGGGGAVTSVSYTTTRLAPFPPSPSNATGGSGTGLVLGFWFVIDLRPAWITEMNRLRQQIYSLPSFGGGSFPSLVSSKDQCVSGPWPGGPTENFTDTKFWYQWTAGDPAPSVSFSSTYSGVSSFGKFDIDLVSNVNTGSFPDTVAEYPMAKKVYVSFDVGGTGGTVAGVFYLVGEVIDGHSDVFPGPVVTPDATVPSSLVSVNGSSNMPGSVAILDVGSSPRGVVVAWTINQFLAAGRYTAILDITVRQDSSDDTTSNTNTQVNFLDTGSANGRNGNGCGSYAYNAVTKSFTVSGLLTISNSYTSGVSASGIDSTKDVYNISLPGNFGEGGFFYFVIQMEKQAPFTWGGASIYNAGDVVVDHNGNTQVCVVNGSSGMAPGTLPYDVGAGAVDTGPPYGVVNSYWATSVGNYTYDNGIIWQCTAVSSISMPNHFIYPCPQPVFLPDREVAAPNTITTVPGSGLWTSMVLPLTSLNVPSESQMPWNLSRTKKGSGGGTIQVNPMLLADQAPDIAGTPEVSGSYDQTKTVEKQLEPAAWIASRYFPVGFQIMDSNGNFQKVASPGVTGTIVPAWSTTAGAATADNGVSWTCAKVAPSSRYSTQAVHRIHNIPPYPCYWFSETVAKLKPPTIISGLTRFGANNQWQQNFFSGGSDEGWQHGNEAYGWWIYSVAINRLTWNASPVSVTFGCVRNGSFVSFGTYNSGQTIRVLWPVFTSDALVYQCSERLDVQPLSIAAVANSVGTGYFPFGFEPKMVADFINSTLSLLGLI